METPKAWHNNKITHYRSPSVNVDPGAISFDKSPDIWIIDLFCHKIDLKCAICKDNSISDHPLCYNRNTKFSMDKKVLLTLPITCWTYHGRRRLQGICPAPPTSRWTDYCPTRGWWSSSASDESSRARPKLGNILYLTTKTNPSVVWGRANCT